MAFGLIFFVRAERRTLCAVQVVLTLRNAFFFEFFVSDFCMFKKKVLFGKLALPQRKSSMMNEMLEKLGRKTVLENSRFAGELWPKMGIKAFFLPLPIAARECWLLMLPKTS